MRTIKCFYCWHSKHYRFFPTSCQQRSIVTDGLECTGMLEFHLVPWGIKSIHACIYSHIHTSIYTFCASACGKPQFFWMRALLSVLSGSCRSYFTGEPKDVCALWELREKMLMSRSHSSIQARKLCSWIFPGWESPCFLTLFAVTGDCLFSSPWDSRARMTASVSAESSMLKALTWKGVSLSVWHKKGSIL